MQVTAFSEQKGNTDCQPRLNSVSGLLLASYFGFGKIHQHSIKVVFNSNFCRSGISDTWKKYHFNGLYL